MSSPNPSNRNLMCRCWLGWIDREPETLYLATITLAELQTGIEILTMGKRRKALQDATMEMLAQFEGRVLSFD